MIYHLVSNFRWTERSEPAADLVLGQCESGAEARLVCGRNRAREEDSVAYQARRKGLDPTVLEFPKHFRWRAAYHDIRALRGLLAQTGGQHVFHSHLPNAQLMAVLTTSRCHPRALVVHSHYDPDGASIPLRTRVYAAAGTRGWVVISPRAAATLVNRYGVPSEQVAVIEPPVDVERFQAPQITSGAARARFGLSPDDVVVGLVTRIGTNRGILPMLQALQRIGPQCPGLRCLVIGRGDIAGAITKPAAELGISERIVLGGYCRDDQLVAAYRAMDVYGYMQPGTDKSCRAIREAMSAGVAVVGRRMGYIPDLVREGETGLLFADTDGLASALQSLYADRQKCIHMGQAAAADAAARFDRKQQGQKVLAFYQRLLAARA